LLIADVAEYIFTVAKDPQVTNVIAWSARKMILHIMLKFIFGIALSLLGVIIALHSAHFVVGLLVTFAGIASTLSALPTYHE
jgi:hypothetical protein